MMSFTQASHIVSRFFPPTHPRFAGSGSARSMSSPWAIFAPQAEHRFRVRQSRSLHIQ